MDKLTIQISTDGEQRGQELQQLLWLRMEATLHKGLMECQSYKDLAEIVLERSEPQAGGKSEKGRKDWLEAVCAALADYILEHEEEKLLRGLIVKDKRYSAEDAEDLLNYCRQLEEISDTVPVHKGDHTHGRARRHKLLVQELTGCLDQAVSLNLDGFLRFRLGKYGTELNEIIEYASDEYVMDQQYKEFISLLRYFVYIQDTKIPVAHIMHKGGHEFLLLDEHMKPIDTTELDTTFKVEFLDKDYNLEDLIVSTLITLAPERIYIHTREPELAVIKTISQIFEQRVQLCGYCRNCSPLLDKLGQKNKLST